MTQQKITWIFNNEKFGMVIPDVPQQKDGNSNIAPKHYKILKPKLLQRGKESKKEQEENEYNEIMNPGNTIFSIEMNKIN